MSHRIIQLLRRSKQRGLPLDEILQRCARLGMDTVAAHEALAAMQEAGVVTVSGTQVQLERNDAEIARLRHAVCLRCGRSDLAPDGEKNSAQRGSSEADSLRAAEASTRLVFGYCSACRPAVTWK